jgi:hypothetical protein
VCTPCTRRDGRQHRELNSTSDWQRAPSQAPAPVKLVARFQPGRMHAHSLPKQTHKPIPAHPNQAHTSHTHTPTCSRGLLTCTTPTEPTPRGRASTAPQTTTGHAVQHQQSPSPRMDPTPHLLHARAAAKRDTGLTCRRRPCAPQPCAGRAHTNTPPSTHATRQAEARNGPVHHRARGMRSSNTLDPWAAPTQKT